MVIVVSRLHNVTIEILLDNLKNINIPYNIKGFKVINWCFKIGDRKMKTYLSSRILVIIAVAFVLPVIALAEANLTPEQLVLLMKASREQYNTIDAKMMATSYQYDPNNKAEPKLKSTRDIVSHWTRDKSFSRTVETSYPDTIPREDYTPTIITTCAITPSYAKRLVEAPDNRTPRGYVRSGTSLESLEKDQPFYTIYTAMWDFSGWPWEYMNLDEAVVTRDEKNKCYIMKVKMGSSPKGPLITLYIDPSKSFIPVEKEFLKYDGTLLLKYKCSDFHQVGHRLWIPYRYSWFDPRVNYGAVYEVERVTVNEPIAEELLDFAFPAGTIVYDNIVNVRYKINDANQAQEAIVDPCSAIMTDVAVTAPAKEDALVASALKAKELLDTHASVKAIESPAIKVSPTVVLVTADKYEYKLSVKKYDGTKAILLNYKFDGSGLELSSFKNLIDNEDQLIVNIDRLQSHTGFAKGILVLQFTGENEPVKITFVSAPL